MKGRWLCECFADLIFFVKCGVLQSVLDNWNAHSRPIFGVGAIAASEFGHFGVPP